LLSGVRQRVGPVGEVAGVMARLLVGRGVWRLWVAGLAGVTRWRWPIRVRWR
jgi:hypothetical protein